jgi:ATP-dependent Clp protease ATP-binding subunit ClpC
MPKTSTFENELAAWTELDLTEAASRGALRPAFEVDAELDQVGEVIEAGRHLIVVGDSGVGKTALIHELVRRMPRNIARTLNGARVLQLSFGRRASGLSKPDQIRPAMQKLVEELLQAGRAVVPFFRDIHLAAPQNLEAQLLALYLASSGPVLGEGDRTAVITMLENEPDLAQHCVVLEIDEPSLERTSLLLTTWAEAQARSGGGRFEPEALTEAAHLSHRFLARARLPRKALHLLADVASLAGERSVTRKDVVERFCRTHRVPSLLVDPTVPLQLPELSQRLAEEVLGQPEAVEATVRMVGMIKAGLSDVRRPFGVFLFVGPTGVGKTHLAQALARLLFGSGDRLVRINMGDFPKEEDALLLMGNPDAYLISQKRGLLTRRLLGHPFAVVLFDEFEKCHEKLHDRLLQLMDEGAFINGAGEVVSCRSCVLIATSNTGAEVYRNQAVGFATSLDLEGTDREVDRRLLQRFRFEFLNRFDQVVHFHPLSQEHIRKIAQRELQELGRRSGLARRQLRLEADESVLDWLAVEGYDPLYGARVLRRAIERHVAVALAETIVRTDPAPGSTLELTVRGRRLEVHLRQSARPAPPRAAVAITVGATPRMAKLDPHELIGEAQRLLRSAADRSAWLERQEDERERVLQALNRQGGWDGSGEGQVLLPRYRELDKAIRSARHLLRPARDLEARLAERATRPDLEALARAVERAAEAARRWQEQLTDAPGNGAWLLVSDADPLHRAPQWITDLVELERHWLNRLHLTASLVACELHKQRLSRAVLEVDGPGTVFYLGMERGLHRFCPSRGAVQKARVDLLPEIASDPTDVLRRASSIRRRRGPLDLDIATRLQIELPGRGLTLDLLGADLRTLDRLGSHLERARPGLLTEPVDVARVYGEGGGGAHDPRTGARVRQLKDALKGKLDPLLEAWRDRAG